MSKTENLKRAYDAIKSGFTIKCNGCEIWIYTQDYNYNASDYGRTYIGWYHYGSSSVRLGIQHLRFIMRDIAHSEDYSFEII